MCAKRLNKNNLCRTKYYWHKKLIKVISRTHLHINSSYVYIYIYELYIHELKYKITWVIYV